MAAVKYKVLLAPRIRKELQKIPRQIGQKILDTIEDLGREPRPPGCEKMGGAEDTYRIRQGGYRVIYEIKDGELIVLVLRIGHRKDVYRNFG